MNFGFKLVLNKTQFTTEFKNDFKTSYGTVGFIVPLDTL